MHDRIFRALLRLLPAEFRGDYGREIETAFRDERREVKRPRALLGLWIAAIADILKTAPSEHWDILKRDLRFAFRTAWVRPAHTVTAVLTLALGLGTSILMFSVVDAVLLTPLPYRDPQQLVMIEEASRGDSGPMGYLTFVDLKERTRTLESAAAMSQSFATLGGDGKDAEQLGAMRVSSSYFHLIGVQPAMGRAFTEAEDRPGPARRVVILTDALWRRRYAADPAILGKPISVGGNPFVVVGIMPRGFEDLIAQRLYTDAQLWVPLGYDASLPYACRTCRHLRVVGRTALGVSRDAAERELTDLVKGLAVQYPTQYNEPKTKVIALSDQLLGPIRTTLWVLSLGVMALLLVACGTVANLMILRASDRSREIAVRAALGVSPGRMARQLITESMFLSITSALVGLLPALAFMRVLAVSGPSQLPRLQHIAMDARASLFALALSMGSAALFGLAPMRQWLRQNLAENIHGAGRTTGGSFRVRAGLVAANVAMASVLLVGSGLLVRSLAGLLAVEPGFNPANTLTFRVSLSGPEYQGDDNAKVIAQAVGYYDRLLTSLRGLPGVTGAAGVTTLPLGGGVDGFGFHIASRPLANPESAPSAERFVVTPGYFEAMRTPLTRGRLLDERDAQTAQKVVVIDEKLATALFPNEDPLGQDIMLGPADADHRTIVGIVGNVAHHGLDAAPSLQVYVPQGQWAWAETALTLVVRTSGDAPALATPIRQILREIDPLQPMTAMQTYDDVIAASMGARRLTAWLLSFFAMSALALPIVGLYGAVSVLVSQREREMGVRLALGAGSTEIRRLVLRDGMKPALAGIALGFALTAAAVAFLKSLVFGISVFDPATFVFAFGALTVAALVACGIPASRASKMDPARTLRAE